MMITYNTSVMQDMLWGEPELSALHCVCAHDRRVGSGTTSYSVLVVKIKWHYDVMF